VIAEPDGYTSFHIFLQQPFWSSQESEKGITITIVYCFQLLCHTNSNQQDLSAEHLAHLL